MEKKKTMLRSVVLQLLTGLDRTYGKAITFFTFDGKLVESHFMTTINALSFTNYKKVVWLAFLWVPLLVFPWYSLNYSHAKNMYSSSCFSWPLKLSEKQTKKNSTKSCYNLLYIMSIIENNSFYPGVGYELSILRIWGGKWMKGIFFLTQKGNPTDKQGESWPCRQDAKLTTSHTKSSELCWNK